ncbi:rRNA maturation RNase YbeY [Candidatus Margulisiibacteriota bacterium]
MSKLTKENKVIFNVLNNKESQSEEVQAGKLEMAILKVLEYEGVSGKVVSLTIADDDFVRDLNSKYRDKDYPTDVLSFPMDEDDLLGDIVISLPAAIRNSLEYTAGDLAQELNTLVIHGTFHLLGYDHESDEDAVVMAGKEAAANSGFTGNDVILSA